MPLGIGIGISSVLGGNGGGGITYLLRDKFTTTESAPLATPRTAEPGPGTWNITDPDNKLSITGGQLHSAGKGAGAAPALVSVASFPRSAGLALVSTWSNVVTEGRTGVWLNSTNPSSGRLLGMRSSGVIYANFIDGTLKDLALTLTDTGVEQRFLSILRDVGGFLVHDNGSNYKLAWIVSVGTDTPVYANALWVPVNNQIDINSIAATQLPAPWNTDYGIATSRLAGTRSAGDTFTHEANFVAVFTTTTVPTVGNVDFHFRIQDASNYWQVRITSAGTLQLNEIVAGVPTTRGSSVGVVSNGERVVVIADGTTITVYENNTERISYASATNFQTATDGELDALGTLGAVSDIVAWPRTLSGAALAALESV